MTPFGQILVRTTTIPHHTECGPATTAHNARLHQTECAFIQMSAHPRIAPSGRRSLSLKHPLHWKLQPLRYLHDRSSCYRLERQLPGANFTHCENAPWTAH